MDTTFGRLVPLIYCVGLSAKNPQFGEFTQAETASPKPVLRLPTPGPPTGHISHQTVGPSFTPRRTGAPGSFPHPGHSGGVVGPLAQWVAQ